MEKIRNQYPGCGIGKSRIREKNPGSATLLVTGKKQENFLLSLPGMVEHVAGHVEGSRVAVVQADPVEKPNDKDTVSRKLLKKDDSKKLFL
jgi:hypothetical protein